MPIPITIVGGDHPESRKASRIINELLQENERCKSQLRQIDDAVEGMKYEMDDGCSQPLMAYERLKKILSEVRW